jgi:hypothetical protein
MTGRSTPATIAWLRADRDAHRTIWYQKCLQRARLARNFPAVFPSALAAQHGTPMSDRVYDRAKFRQGMVVFLDNPHDSNPFGHIVTDLGRTKTGTILTDTNDALIRGGGSVVNLDWFRQHWNVPVVFAARSLNGFDLDLGAPGTGKHPQPEPKPKLVNVEYAEHRLTKAINYWREKGGHRALVDALVADRNRVRKTIREFGA